jgi:hypothetical protein
MSGSQASPRAVLATLQALVARRYVYVGRHRTPHRSGPGTLPARALALVGAGGSTEADGPDADPAPPEPVRTG